MTAAAPDAQLVLEEAGAGLSGRAKREAEIAAMMNSLEQTPQRRPISLARLLK